MCTFAQLRMQSLETLIMIMNQRIISDLDIRYLDIDLS